MSVIASHRLGTFCWPELCTDNAEATKRFYASLFGWEVQDQHMPDGDYALFRIEGQLVGSTYQMAEDRKKAGVQPHWNSYVAVENADETAKKAADLGGKVLMQPFEGGDYGRMANLEDPTGVKFSIWQGKTVPEPTRLGEIGSLCWTELITTDTSRSSEFYSKLLGWQPTPFEGGNAQYTVFNLPGIENGVGGMMEMCGDMPLGPHWMPYFRVEDTGHTAERVRELGGKVLNPPMDIPTVGRIATFLDTQGAGFSVIQVIM